MAVSGQASRVRIEPDGMNSEALRRAHLPFQMVADHPGLMRTAVERLQGMQIGALIRLAETGFAFDLNMVEAP
jgi:hypothetical protein